MTRMTRVTWETLQPLRAVISRIARARGKTMAQVAMNWTMSKGHVVLVGCKTVAHIEAAAGAVSWRLEPNEVAELDAVALDRSTLEKPRCRRGFFMGLLSVLVCCYYVERRCCCPSTRHEGRLEERQAAAPYSSRTDLEKRLRTRHRKTVCAHRCVGGGCGG